jgi:hypothetical protein
MKEQIDWHALALDLGAITENGEKGSSALANRAVEILIGEDNLRQAVEYYVTFKPGSELARSVLWMLHPFSAMQHCYDIYKSDAPIQERRQAVELLRVVADRRAVGWIAEFLKDEDEEIQGWGAGVLDQLLWSDLVFQEEVEDLLQMAESHENSGVRDTAEFIKGFLQRRDGNDKQTGNEKAD